MTKLHHLIILAISSNLFDVVGQTEATLRAAVEPLDHALDVLDVVLGLELDCGGGGGGGGGRG